ncbi:hypothetical protein FRB99_004183 [Tulasnella sp. 403]|nr:hypothetical protein FRB99_004183 [Tulasnella sp. 403]
MVGTVFVHAIANSYATYAEDLVVDVEAESSAIVKSLSLPGSLETSVSGSSICVALGPLQYGQTKDIIVNIPNGLTKSPLTVSARCRPWNLEGEIKVTRVINDSHLPAADTPPDPSVLYHNHRLEFSQKGLEAGGSEFKAPNRMYGSSRVPFPNEATATFKQLVALTRASFPGGSSTNDGGTPSISTYAHDLASDIENEVLLGVQDAAAFNRWGQHYILSLSRSHQRQQCSNFKDMGLQCYGQDSPLFVASRNEIDRVFDDLPPPEPKQPPVMQIQPSMMMQAPPSSSFGGAFGAPSAQAPPASTSIGARPMMFASMVHPQQQMQQQTFKKISSMSRYNQQQAPCFSGSCLVDLSDGAKVSVEAIRSGSTVKTPTGTATVMAVIKTVIQGGVLDMCHLGEGLVITPWHPIFQDGEWRFPAEIATPRRTPCNAVYSLVLEANRDPDAHAATIGGMLCVTMGHGVTTTGGANDARSHPFLGSHSSVIRALAAVEAYKNDGGVYVSLGARKDPVTGLMNGFVWDTVTKLDEGVELRSEVGKPILALV